MNLSRYSCIILLIVTNLATSCYSALASTPFCADDSWAMWWISGPANSGYFCCLDGQIGLTSKQCVSNEEVIASSLTASFVRNSFHFTFLNRRYHSVDLTYNPFQVGISITSGATFQTSTAAAASSSESSASSTLTPAPTSTKGNLGGTIKSAVASILHNDAKPVAVAPVALGGVISAIVAIFL